MAELAARVSRSLNAILKPAMSHRYTVLLFPGGHGWVTATVPALPGCVSQGRDSNEALENAREAIEAWTDAWLSQKARRLPSESLRMVLRGIEEALEIQREIGQEDQQDVEVALELRTVTFDTKVAA